MNTGVKPPFDRDSACDQVCFVNDTWNRRDPELVIQMHSAHCNWRIRDQCFSGRAALKAFLTRKWAVELHYRLNTELQAFTENRILVRFEYEWQHAVSGQWYRTQGNSQAEFDAQGLMCRCDICANDIAISASARRIGV